MVDRIHCLVEGDGPPVVLIHGWASSMGEWTLLRPALLQAGYRIYVLDLPGHGDSLKPATAQSCRAGWVFNLLQDWVESLQLSLPPVLVGHSFGGYLSLRYASLHPQATGGLVLIAPLYTVRQLPWEVSWCMRQAGFSARILKMTPRWLLERSARFNQGANARFSPAVRQQIARDFKRASPYIFYLPLSIQSLDFELRQIKMPALVLWGDRDLSLQARYFPPLVGTLPQASGICFLGAGHQPHLTVTQAVHAQIVNFLEGVFLHSVIGFPNRHPVDI